MKYFFSFLLAFTSGNVFASDSNFLTEEQFRSLSREDKAHYIRAVQRILATMSKQTLFMAEAEAPDNSRMPAAALLTAQPTSKDKNDITSLLVNTLRKEKKLDQQLEDLNAVDFSDPKKTSFVPDKIPTVPAKTSPSVATTPASAPAPATPMKKAPASSPVIANIPVTKAIKEKTKKEAEQATPDKEIKPRTNYRCMYAGWVVTENPCTGVNKLPTGWEIDGTDPNKMVCETSKTMCNPFVFGLRLEKPCKSMDENDCSKKATPICVNKGAWPTEACYKESSFQEALVAADIQSTIAPTQFNTYKQLFQDLCDKEQIAINPFAEPQNRRNKNVSAKAVRRDITITCAWANKKLALVTDAYNIRAGAGNNADEMKRWSEDNKIKTQK